MLSTAIPMLMLALGLVLTGAGLLGLARGRDSGALGWLAPSGPASGASDSRLATAAIFGLVTLSGALLALGGLLDL